MMTRRSLGLSLVPGLLALLPAACVDETPKAPAEQCVPTERYFAEEVWAPFMGNTCFTCHNAQGIARGTDLVLQSPNQPGYLEANLATVQNVAAFERDGVSILLLKPSAQISHGGGQVIEKDGPEYKALQGLVERFKNPIECEDVEIEDPFYERLKEIYNDLFLTNRYLGNTRAVDLLDGSDYPNRRWHTSLDPEVHGERFVERAQRYTNDSVAQEPLELIAYVVRNNLPFTEILTADYTVVNPYSARVFGIDNVSFKDPTDPKEFVPARVEGIPHAGVLTSPMFLNRFPTPATNRNRHRARMVYQFFLATDVMRLAERPNDPSSIIDHNPTMNNPCINSTCRSDPR